jgi:hypothetical protein
MMRAESEAGWCLIAYELLAGGLRHGGTTSRLEQALGRGLHDFGRWLEDRFGREAGQRRPDAVSSSAPRGPAHLALLEGSPRLGRLDNAVAEGCQAHGLDGACSCSALGFDTRCWAD